MEVAGSSEMPVSFTGHVTHVTMEKRIKKYENKVSNTVHVFTVLSVPTVVI
jgi:hypothetical protein